MIDPKDFSNIPGIVHDIRQMLTVIAGRAGLLLEKNPDPDLKRHLLAMELAAADANTMLGRLPGISGGRELSLPVSLGQVVRESCGLILPPGGHEWAAPTAVPAAGVWSLDIRVPEDLFTALPAQVLREVVNNLLANALDALPGGGSVVLQGSSRGERLFLTVTDSGPGVPEELRERIFQHGFSTSGKPERGLGLAGSRELLEDFGGHLELDPAAGPGAVFVLDLPAVAGGAGTLPAQEEPGRQPEPEPGEILVVDDEPAVREMLADVLGELGWRPTIAVNADEARRVFAPERFPVALVDQSLPGMSGLELASELRKQDPRIVLVLVTGWNNEDIATRAPAHGFDFAEEKPLTVGKIRLILGKAAVLFKERDLEGEES